MTDLKQYAGLIDAVFGPQTHTFNTAGTATNNVIGALASTNNFVTFRAAFIARLHRLNKAYAGHTSRSDLLTQVNLVGDAKNWEGAIAELAAYDFFSSQLDFIGRPPTLNTTVDLQRSLAARFGAKEANLDAHFERFNAYTDIKALKDNVSEILEGIYKEVWPKSPPMISTDYRLDADYHLVKAQRPSLRDALRHAIADGAHPPYVDCSHIVEGLKFRLRWDRGALITESTYSAYRHAEDLHRLPLLHAKKFVTDATFFLTFVSFPWFNKTITDFNDANRIFYRSLARRVFCQYRHDPTPFSLLYPTFRGNETVHEVSRQLGGILFLEDRSIDAENPDAANVLGYYYDNPNGHRTPFNGLMDSYLQGLVVEHDDFLHDNY